MINKLKLKFDSMSKRDAILLTLSVTIVATTFVILIFGVMGIFPVVLENGLYLPLICIGNILNGIRIRQSEKRMSNIIFAVSGIVLVMFIVSLFV